MNNYKAIASEIHSQVSPFLPAGLTITTFRDGGGTYGVSFYAYILNAQGEKIVTLRISDHSSHCQFADNCICGSWNFPDIFVQIIAIYFAPKTQIVVQMDEEFPNVTALLKMFPNAQNIVQGEYVRIAKKSGNPIYNFTFTLIKTVLA